jgi:hypothetical protein
MLGLNAGLLSGLSRSELALIWDSSAHVLTIWGMYSAELTKESLSSRATSLNAGQNSSYLYQFLKFEIPGTRI